MHGFFTGYPLENEEVLFRQILEGEIGVFRNPSKGSSSYGVILRELGVEFSIGNFALFSKNQDSRSIHMLANVPCATGGEEEDPEEYAGPTPSISWSPCGPIVHQHHPVYGMMEYTKIVPAIGVQGNLLKRYAKRKLWGEDGYPFCIDIAVSGAGCIEPDHWRSFVQCFNECIKNGPFVIDVLEIDPR